MTPLTNRKTRALIFVTGMTALTACGIGDGTWNREAGAQLDDGEFGNATMQNIAAQVCFPGGKSARNGGGKFGHTPGDPVVVLDPASTRVNPIYRVHCDGRLDGKYARIVYRDYVNSAGQEITVTNATAE
ncbi:hypothetical protein [Roseobacter sp.]|uniref:hypothetical protein n=1 Tax=Roseobacter sp. TaxID=1907202 RepID=UPI00329A628F